MRLSLREANKRGKTIADIIALLDEPGMTVEAAVERILSTKETKAKLGRQEGIGVLSGPHQCAFSDVQQMPTPASKTQYLRYCEVGFLTSAFDCTHRKQALRRNLPKLNAGWASCLLANVVSFRAPGIFPVDTRQSRRELEAAWRERVDRARARYAEKIAIRKQMVAERPVWPINLAPDPDGRFALNLALQEESAARTEYMRLLKIYVDIILHGTPPKEEPGS